MSQATHRTTQAARPGWLSRGARRFGSVGLVAALAAAVMVVLPASPAFAVQTISWVVAPPSTADAGSTMSFSFTGTANTIFAPRITGCFVSFPDGNNYTNSFGGNFTLGNCQYVARPLPTLGNYTMTVGFTMSSGPAMSLNWTVSVGPPPPTLLNLPSSVTAVATSTAGTPVSYGNIYAADSYYGTYSASCSPASGALFPIGESTASCSATNAGGRTTTVAFSVTVVKATPVIDWSPGTAVYGEALDSTLNATMSSADATGTITYTDDSGTSVDASTVLPVGDGQAITATYTPTGAAADTYNPVSVTRTLDVIPVTQAVAFTGPVPATATFGDPSFTVTATGTSDGGQVSIGAATGSSCTVTQTGTGTTASASVDLTAAGGCVLVADQAGSYGHTAAPQTQHSVTVAKATPALTWAQPGTMTYGSPLTSLLTATTPPPGTFTYRLNGQIVTGATVPDVGSAQVLDVTWAPYDPANYTTATATRTLTVTPAAQTLTVAPVPGHVFGDQPFDLDVDGAGPGAVTATATGACSVENLEVTVVTAGDCTVSVAKAGTPNYLPASPVTRTFTIAKATVDLRWDDPATISYGTALGAEQLDAVAVPAVGDPTGQVDYTLDDGTPALGTVLHVGTYTLHAQWSAVGASAGDWEPVTSTVTLHVAPAAFSGGPAASITGTPQVGQQLTAHTGVTTPAADSYSYRWFADGTEIAGATGATLDTPVSAQGKAISVEVNATKADYTDSTDLSAATAPVATGALGLTGSVTVTGAATVGQTLSAASTVAATPAGAQTGQWQRDGVDVTAATGTTYALTNADAGHTLTYRVTVTAAGFAAAALSSNAVGPVGGGIITLSALTVGGAPVVDGTLTASLPGTGTDPAGASVEYSWTRGQTVVGTGDSYSPRPADAGHALTVTATASKAYFGDATATAVSATVTPGQFISAPTATITGTVKVGETLTAGVGIPAPAPDSYQYQWYADGTPITGAVQATHTLSAGQANAAITVAVTAVRAGYTPASSTSAATGPVAPSLAPSVRMSAGKDTLRRGQATELSWTSEGATSLAATGAWTGARAATGAVTIRPTSLGVTTYVLAATNATGTTTAQVTVTVTRQAKALRVAASNGLHLTGTRVHVIAAGLDPREPYTIRIAGNRVATGLATSTGRVDRTFRIPSRVAEGRAGVVVTGSQADRRGSATVRVVTNKRLGLTLAHGKVRASDSQRYTVRGLAARERVTVTYQGKRISPSGAHANQHGVYTAKFAVGFNWGTKFVTVTGQFPGRTATKGFKVVRRCTSGQVCS